MKGPSVIFDLGPLPLRPHFGRALTNRGAFILSPNGSGGKEADTRNNGSGAII